MILDVQRVKAMEELLKDYRHFADGLVGKYAERLIKRTDDIL